jgi:hypothetical protein
MTKQDKNNFSHQASDKNLDEKLVNLFVSIIQQQNKVRMTTLLLLFCFLIAGIYGSIKINIFMLFLPVILYYSLRRFINPIHDKNIKKYIEKNSDKINPDLISKLSNLNKETKVRYYEKALAIEIKNNLNRRKN